VVFIVQLLCITLAVITVAALTGNALALLGFCFMWSHPPIFAPGDRENEDSVDARGIGFVQKE
jgi:hypothetical protein